MLTYRQSESPSKEQVIKTGRPATPITLSEPERAELLRRIAKRKGAC